MRQALSDPPLSALSQVVQGGSQVLLQAVLPDESQGLNE